MLYLWLYQFSVILFLPCHLSGQVLVIYEVFQHLHTQGNSIPARVPQHTWMTM